MTHYFYYFRYIVVYYYDYNRYNINTNTVLYTMFVLGKAGRPPSEHLVVDLL